MNKIFIVAQREFLTRVKKKTFLLTTIGLPILISAVYALIIYFSINSTTTLKLAISDNANIFNGELLKNQKEKAELKFLASSQTQAELEKDLDKEKIDGFIYVPQNFSLNNNKDSIRIISSKSIGLMSQQKIESKINKILEQRKITTSLNITNTALDSLKTTNEIKFAVFKNGKIDGGDESIKSGLSYAVGFIGGFLIYLSLFIYGTMVMRGVMEEKTNRIAEVIVSSVKPFQLMMGKILGIGSVGLLQFFIWIVLTMIMSAVTPLIFHNDVSQMQAMQPGMMQGVNEVQQSGVLNKIDQIKNLINIPLILGCFMFYFFGGYFLYASLFAAIGSTVNEDQQEAQSLVLPITMPIIFAFVIAMQAVNDPNSPIAVFGSLFPLTSPIVMMARVAHGVPEGVSVMQLIISMVFLILGFIGTTWLAAKIYRTGILMYGKKVTFKELAKWAFKKSA